MRFRFTDLGQYTEYIPLIILSFLFVAEAEIGNKVMNTTWNIIATMGLLIILYILLVFVKLPKLVVVGIAAVIWVVYIFVKRRFIHRIFPRY